MAAATPLLATPSARRPLGGPARFGISLTAGLAAGVIAFAFLLVMSRYGLFFGMPDELMPLLSKDRLTPEEADTLNAAYRLRDYQNTALVVAVLGGAVGSLLGFAAGLVRRSASAASAGLLGGALAGAAAGAVGGVVDLFTLERLWNLELDATYKSMTAHTSAFLIAGLGIGTAAGIAARSLPRTLGAVLAAGSIAGVLYPGIAAHLFPIFNTDAAIPEGFFALLLWTVLPAGLMGLAIGRTKVTLPRLPLPLKSG